MTTYTANVFSSGVIADKDGNVISNLMQKDVLAGRVCADDGTNKVAALFEVHLPYAVNAETPDPRVAAYQDELAQAVLRSKEVAEVLDRILAELAQDTASA
jgi:hypothetical protein